MYWVTKPVLTVIGKKTTTKTKEKNKFVVKNHKNECKTRIE